jgi:2,3-bisphosphoglycerate-independent phosphoglycerate mutase
MTSCIKDHHLLRSYHAYDLANREEEPMSVVYYHAGSTRRDEVQRFTERECREKGANLFISAEQFLSELAFKLGKTPKYGA